MNNLSIYSININGINSKVDSLLHILEDQSPDIVTINETKTSQYLSIKKNLRKLNYEMIVRKEGGIAILAKENLQMKNVTVSNHPNILTALLSNKDNRIRIVTIYGLHVSSS